MSELLSSRNIVSGTIWRFGEKITSQLVSFTVSIILARLLMPNDYGIVAIVNVFIVIAEVFVTSGLGTSLIQKKDADERDFSTIFWCNIILSFVLYAVVFFASPIIADFYSIPLLKSVLRVFGLRLPISSINSIQNAYVSRRMDFKKFFFATIIGTSISGVVGIVMANMGFGVWSLIAQCLTNSIIDTLVLFIVIRWRPIFYFDFRKAKPLISYGWKILLTDLIGQLFNQLSTFIIGKKYTSSDLAYYTQGKKIPNLLNDNIGGTLSAVLFPAMSLSADKNQIISIRRKSLKMLEFVIFPIMFGLIAVADKLIVVLMTDKWLFAVPYLRIYCLTAIIGVLGTTLIQEIKAIGRSDLTLKIELIKKPIYIIVIMVAMKFGVVAISLASILIEIIAFLVNVYPVKKYIGFDLKMHLVDAFPSLIMSVIMFITVYILGKIIPNILFCLLVQIIVGITVYIILSIITKNDSIIYLKKMILVKTGK